MRSEISGRGLGKGSRWRSTGIEEAIRERIEAGWAFCGHVPLEIRAKGDIETLSLVSQRDG